MMKAGKKKAPKPTRANAVRAIHRERVLEFELVIREKSRVPPRLDEVDCIQLFEYSWIVGKY